MKTLKLTIFVLKNVKYLKKIFKILYRKKICCQPFNYIYNNNKLFLHCRNIQKIRFNKLPHFHRINVMSFTNNIDPIIKGINKSTYSP